MGRSEAQGHQKSWAAAIRAVGTHSAAPAALAYARWAAERARALEIDLLLVRAPLAATFDALAAGGVHPLADGPRWAVLEGSVVSFSLAAASHPSFTEGFDLLVTYLMGLPLRAALRRMGVLVPAEHVLSDLGFAEDRPLGPEDEPALRRFLFASRQEVMRAALRARRGLFLHLLAIGFQQGQRIALLDVDGTGATFESFGKAMEPLPSATLCGFDVLLLDAPDVRLRRTVFSLVPMVAPESAEATALTAPAGALRLMRALLAPAACDLTAYGACGEGIVPLYFPPRDGLAPEARDALLAGLKDAARGGVDAEGDPRAMEALLGRLADPAARAPLEALFDLG